MPGSVDLKDMREPTYRRNTTGGVHLPPSYGVSSEHDRYGSLVGVQERFTLRGAHKGWRCASSFLNRTATVVDRESIQIFRDFLMVDGPVISCAAPRIAIRSTPDTSAIEWHFNPSVELVRARLARSKIASDERRQATFRGVPDDVARRFAG